MWEKNLKKNAYVHMCVYVCVYIYINITADFAETNTIVNQL